MESLCGLLHGQQSIVLMQPHPSYITMLYFTLRVTKWVVKQLKSARADIQSSGRTITWKPSIVTRYLLMAIFMVIQAKAAEMLVSLNALNCLPAKRCGVRILLVREGQHLLMATLFVRM